MKEPPSDSIAVEALLNSVEQAQDAQQQALKQQADSLNREYQGKEIRKKEGSSVGGATFRVEGGDVVVSFGKNQCSLGAFQRAILNGDYSVETVEE